MISARQVKSLRARYGSAGNKDDRFDAFVLADALRTDAGRWAVVQPDSQETIALRMLVRARHDLIDHRVAVHNQLLAVLQHNFPGTIGLFSQLDIPISLAFLRRFPTEAKAAWLSELRMAHWLKANHYCGRHTPTTLVEPPARGSHRPHHRRRSRGQRSHRLDPRRPAHHPARGTDPTRGQDQGSPPGPPRRPDLPVPPTRRDRPRGDPAGRDRRLPRPLPRPAALAAAAGVAPSTRQSGKHLNVAYRRGCNKHLRAALVDWAQDTPRANAWARDTYDRSRDRGCRHPHAARILAQDWTRILWRCWHDHTPYNPDLHGRLSILLQEAA